MMHCEGGFIRQPIQEGGGNGREEESSKEESSEEESEKGGQETGEESPVRSEDTLRKAVQALRDRKVEVLRGTPLVGVDRFCSLRGVASDATPPLYFRTTTITRRPAGFFAQQEKRRVLCTPADIVFAALPGSVDSRSHPVRASPIRPA
jgi:hypothetical protein